MMLSPKDFTTKIADACEELYQFQEQGVKSFFEKTPSTETLIDYFSRRMINERINCTEISKRVASMPADTSPEEMFLLCKQAMDEAKHFGFVKEIVEDMLGHTIDVHATYESLKQRQLSGEVGFFPSTLLQKYECSNDPLALATYQYIAEGMAHRNWVMQAECAPTALIKERYAEIAKDEKFHASLGRAAMEKLVTNEETQARAEVMAKEVIGILWDVATSVGCNKKQLSAAALVAL
jgi:hypothetical protein